MPKKPDPESPDGKDDPPPISFLFTNDEKGGEPDDLDTAVIRSLTLLSQAAGHEFADTEMPPASLAKWLSEASLREVGGMLIAILRRWHELQGLSPDEPTVPVHGS